MSSSRVTFVREFERQLRSLALQRWFDALREGDAAALAAFPDAVALRRFLHSSDRADPRKPRMWRLLVQRLHVDRPPEAVSFVLGLLEPALGALADRVAGKDLDPDDVWQETLVGALQALANPKLPHRGAVLAGLVRDTYKHLCGWLRGELAKTEAEGPLVEFPYESDFGALRGRDEEALLGDWCRHADVSLEDAALIRATRLDGKRLSSFAPARSAAYERLRRRRVAAEARLHASLHRATGGRATKLVR
jgi:DNA-directed RNA polymerase specialized sigma24 family protein